jgi:hypothetical protein
VIRRLLGGVALLAFGLLLGLVGAFVQAQRLILDLPWGMAVVPWGVVVAWAALLAGIRAGAWSMGTRWGSWAVLAGWLAATVAMSAESSSGDLALAGGTRQLVYLFGGVVMGSAAATLPLPMSERRPGNP